MALRKKIKSQSKNRVLIVQNSESEGPGLLLEAIKEHGIKFNIIDLNKKQELPSPSHYSALIVLGGPDSANDKTKKTIAALKAIKEALDSKTPFLGICLGMQMLVKACNGNVFKSRIKEIGWRSHDKQFFRVFLTKKGKADALFKGIKSPVRIFQLHGETVKLKKGMRLLAEGRHCKNQVVKIGSNAYGIQGHLELSQKMFKKWIAEDTDLRLLDSALLKSDYAEIRSRYERTGKKMIENFLGTAGLITPR